MQIYHYDDNGLFVRESTARTDPKNPARYLIPRKATVASPPAPGDNQAAVYRDEWELVDDFRGEQHWLADGTPETIAQVGVRPVATVAPGNQVKPHWDGSKWTESASVQEIQVNKTALIKAAERRVRDLRIKVKESTGMSILADDQAELAAAEAELAAIKAEK